MSFADVPISVAEPSPSPPPTYTESPQPQLVEWRRNETAAGDQPPSYLEAVAVSHVACVSSLEQDAEEQQCNSPSDYRRWSYLSACLFLPSGIIALICSLKTKKYRGMGLYDAAVNCSKWTFIANVVSTIVGVFTLLLVFTLFIVYALSSSGPDSRVDTADFSKAQPFQTKIKASTTAAWNWRPVQTTAIVRRWWGDMPKATNGLWNRG